MTVLINPIVPTTDNFADWLAKTNQALGVISNNAITVNSNNAIGVGGINGSFYANVLYTADLRGGTYGAAANLSITTNTTFTSITTFNSNVYLGGTNTAFVSVGAIFIPGSNTTNKFLASNTSTGKTYHANLLAEIVAIDGAGSSVDSDLLDGQQGSFYQDANNINAGILLGARFNDTSHGNRAGGTLHAVANSTINGFMIAADKAKLDAINYTAADILAKLITVDGAGSNLDADLFDGQNATYYTDIPSRLGYSPVNKVGDTMSGTLTIANSAPTINLHSSASNSAILLQNQSGTLLISSTTTIQQTHTSAVSNTVPITSNTATLVHQFSKTAFTGGKYVVTSVNNSANAKSIAELLVVHNIGDAMVTEYAQINSNTAFITFTANTDATNVRLYATSSSNNATVKFVSNLL